ncbi:MAG: hypothetical protein OEU49_02695 [Chromatiales bacterium]|jgi:hypothetical protein|nr:hypothetical protein [Chromatiales bacterium]
MSSAGTGRGKLIPAGEGFRRALRWLSDERRHDPAAVEEASVRFNLSPMEEEFLLAEARRLRGEKR